MAERALTDEEIGKICDRIIALLHPYNRAVKYKVIKSLYDGLVETLEQEGYKIEEIEKA
jgi:hypothetical protein